MSAVPHRLKNTYKNIIQDKGKGAAEINTEVSNGIGQNIRRRTHPDKQLRSETYTDERKQYPGSKAKGYCSMYGLLHLFYFTRSIISADNNACADGDSVEKTNHKENQASRGTDSGQSLAPQEISHNEGVCRIIQLLEQIAQKKRNGKCYDFFQIDPSVISVVCCAVLFINAPVCVYYMHIRPCLYA